MQVRIKRVYEPAEPGDGIRILVDRLWPRGLTKKKAHVDIWLKEIAPSTELRKWFAHDPGKWSGFNRRYQAELKKKPELITLLVHKAEAATVTLLYGARDTVNNEAIVLKRVLDRKHQPS
jgi:uncharacterized protein YeaO (DUF488 family)